jgi:hypothetical protein
MTDLMATIETRMNLVRQYDNWRLRLPWRWLPSPVRLFIYQVTRRDDG